MRVRVAHISMQFSDTKSQHEADVEKIFKRAVSRRQAWITGTESGPNSRGLGEQLIRIGERNGYLLAVPEREARRGTEASNNDCWIAVRKDLVKEGTFLERYEPVWPSSNKLQEQHPELPEKPSGPKGIVYVEFDSTNRDLGHVTVMASHYYTEGHRPGSPWFKMNREIAKAAGRLARKKGQGRGLVFYGGDQNMVDNASQRPKDDSFFGEPLTSTWDEVKTYENTGHGCLDVIATYDGDKRVSAISTVALDDKEFFLNTDHFYVEAEIQVAPIKR